MSGRRRQSWAGGALRLLIAVAAVFVGASILVVGSLRWLDPPTSAFMLRYYLQHEAFPRHLWASADQLPAELGLAVVAAEDQRFPEHWGLDLGAINRALREYADGERLRGASTLTQQVAKNLFLWPGRTLVRKALEAWFALVIEALWTKRRILEVYLNVAQFGPDIFGAATASRIFFDRPVNELTRAQAARLAAVLPNPRGLDAGQPSPRVREREGWILQQMRQLGGTAYIAALWQPGKQARDD